MIIPAKSMNQDALRLLDTELDNQDRTNNKQRGKCHFEHEARLRRLLLHPAHECCYSGQVDGLPVRLDGSHEPVEHLLPSVTGLSINGND